jgi:ADP-heptose:LPS heptosyltransferase
MVIRFSAMGDVALVAPIVRSFLSAFPENKLSMVSRPKFSAFFSESERFRFLPADVDKMYSGLIGIMRLFNQLRQHKPDVVIDLHDHLRSRLLCFMFRLYGAKVVRFQKGRHEKRALTRAKDKSREQLPHTVDRYHQAFHAAGFSFPIVPAPYVVPTVETKKKVGAWLHEKNLVHDNLWIGLAPFAAHQSKIWPIQNYREVIRMALQKLNCRFFLFGGGPIELEFFNQLKNEFPKHCVVAAGELKLHEEIALMGHLDKMLCVDSSNMHLAALAGVPTVSIWGGTHTATGFGAYGKLTHKILEVSVDELTCRPCSVYGRETCLRGDFACLTRIKPEQVVNNL